MLADPPRYPIVLLCLFFVAGAPPARAQAHADGDRSPATTQAPAPPTTPPAPAVGEEELEEEIDFEEEERVSDEQAQEIRGAAGGSHPGAAVTTTTGFKLFVDLLLDYRVGEKKFEFTPNHFYVLVQANLSDDIQVLVHASDNPIFFELTYNITPRIALTAGKLLIPFGTNEFHHILGGRVDERSLFLPETWGDYGLMLRHLVWDGEWVTAEYNFWVVNGFSGTEEPIIAAGTPTDNNAWKGLGARLKLTVLRSIVGYLSAYFDMWNENCTRQILYYSLGAEIRPGLWREVPVLNRLRLRGEYARGEIQLPTGNGQVGIMRHAYAKAGYYIELTGRILDELGPFEEISARVRIGRLNSNNTVADDGDIETYEPAILFRTGKKVWWTIAYQLTARPMLRYDPETPPDVFYAKFFVRF